MGDAFTDINRDARRSQIRYNAEELEKDFCYKPSKKIAKKIIGLYSDYMEARSGWSSPDEELAKERISLFGEYCEGKISNTEILRYFSEEETRLVSSFNGNSELDYDKVYRVAEMVAKIARGQLSEGEESLKDKQIFITPTKGGLEIKLVPQEHLDLQQKRIQDYKQYLPNNK